jgi:hypothetical protein
MLTSDELRDYVIKYKNDRKLNELSQSIGVSKTTLSQYSNGIYPGNNGKMERKLREHISAKSLNFRDERKLLEIIAILDDAENREGIINAIAYGR